MRSLRRMAPFVRPYGWISFFLIITVILPVAMELIVPRALRIVIDQGIVAGQMPAVIRGTSLMLGSALVGAIATLGQGVCRARLSQGLAYDMRNRLFAHVQTFSFANLDVMQTGQLMTRLSSDVDVVRMFVSTGLALLLRALLMIFGSLAMMFAIDAPLSGLTLGLLLVAALLIAGMMRLARPMFRVVQQKLGALNTIVQENLAGVRVVKAFVRERFEIDRFQEFNQAFLAENIRVGRLMAVTLPLLTLLTNLGLVAVIWFGGLSVEGGRLSVGQLVAFNNYLLIGMAPLMMLGNILTMVSRAEASAERVWELLDTRPRVQVATAAHQALRVEGRVRFVDVSFHYDAVTSQFAAANGLTDRDGSNGRSEGPVLANVSFEIEPGQRVALLGATGSGKSSLVHLIPRYYDVSGGRIEVDDVDVRQWQPEALRAQVGMVLQQTILFSGTVRQNIAYGRPDASMQEVVAAAKAAQAHEFISAWPDGYETMVEERGANLSGGQKQRLAIARALLISPSILILDDSTSAVDMETEARIQLALNQLMRGRTTLIVAQRISSVLNADQIIVLDNGQLVAKGSHSQLLAGSSIYQEIFYSQLGDGRETADLAA